MQAIPPLFCKPAGGEPSAILFSKFYSQLKGNITFRSLNLKTDLPLIHEWVNSPYALKYWQMNGHFSQLLSVYQCMEYNPYAHSFVGILNKTIICQLDVYALAIDELKDHVEMQEHDAGFHLLMAPNNHPVKNLTISVIDAFLHFYFSFPQAKRLFGEPDITNEKSVALLNKTGFRQVKTIQMSYKQAHVYTFQNFPYETK